MKSRQRPEHRAVAELFAFAQQPRRGRRESHALALERIERIDLALQRRVRLVGAKQLGARALLRARASRDRRRALPRASSPASAARARAASTATLRAFQLTLECTSSASTSCARSCGELLESLRQLVALAPRALAVDLDAARLDPAARDDGARRLSSAARISRHGVPRVVFLALARARASSRAVAQLRFDAARARRRACSRSVEMRAP